MGRRSPSGIASASSPWPWNEYGEGAAIEPHREWGIAYLDAVRDVFGASRGRHRDLTPGDLGLAVPTAP